MIEPRRTFSDLDEHFARLMVKLAGGESSELYLAAALASSVTGDGHVCLDLGTAAGRVIGNDQKTAPPLDHWARILKESPVVGRPGEFKPLILDGKGRLYLYRYWDYERKLADCIRRLTENTCNLNSSRARESLTRLFSPNERKEDWQKVAAAVSLLRQFVVISGSPGTGKTSTVTRILALLLENAGGGRLRIALAAPTGKAAARLQEMVRIGKEALSVSEWVKAAIPSEASTIHRLLGAAPDMISARYHAGNPLPVDLVVVDEASMVDLPLMSKLAQSLPDSARFVLLGDKDQLSSVEAGAVLGDICGGEDGNAFSNSFRIKLEEITGDRVRVSPSGGKRPGISDSVIQLRENYRFSPDSGISLLSAAVNRGDGNAALALMKSGSFPDVQWSPLPEANALPSALMKYVINYFQNYLDVLESGGNLQNVFTALESFRILCALREGPYGVASINHTVERILGMQRLIRSDERWYHGRPIMITKNDYNLRLFNGDIGIIVRSGDDAAPHACFTDPSGAVRRFAPLRLPDHETVYALTVHKSQGSEFARVLLLLPDRDSPVLSRELIYTGITRTKQEVHLWGREEVFRAAISRKIMRNSGLRDELWDVIA